MSHNKYNTPKIKESKSIQLFTSIWLVPFIAMIIALWLAFQYYSKVGPLVSIEFQENAGLVSKQSHVKLRNVIVGSVENVALSEEGNGVSVQVRMNKKVSKYLNKSAKFWIVHPDVDSSGITGLDTLLSGSYIELKAKKDSYTQKEFVGLEEAPAEDAEGRTYVLSAPKSYHLKKGSNIYYRMIKIGKVQHVNIAPNGKKVTFVLFVHQKYTKYINEKSQFYTTSSVSVDVSKGKLDLTVASLSQLARGGISVYTPTQSLGKEHHLALTKTHIFPLYKSLNQMKSKYLMRGENDKVYKFKFNENISRLEIGSSVEFKNFKIGYVIDISSHFNSESKNIESEIYAIIHTKGFSNNSNDKKGEEIIHKLVAQGLKAQLNSAIPVVGSQYIDLIFDNKSAKLLQEGEFMLFPTIKRTQESNILKEVEQVVIKIKNLELEKLLATTSSLIKNTNSLIENNEKPIANIIGSLEQSIQKLDQTLASFANVAQDIQNITQQESLQALPSNLEATLFELTSTLEELKVLSKDYNADSRFSSQLSLTMQELGSMAESMKNISRKLERKPNALLLGDD